MSASLNVVWLVNEWADSVYPGRVAGVCVGDEMPLYTLNVNVRQMVP